MMTTPTLDDTQPLDTDAIRRAIAKLSADRIAAYETYILPIDAALIDAVSTLRIASGPTCDVCGAEDTPSGCVNAACERFNQCGF
jgi:hypothetical protein